MRRRKAFFAGKKEAQGAYTQAEAYRRNVGGFASRHGIEVRSTALRFFVMGTPAGV